MRVVVVADFAEAGGGAQRVALESARALAEAGVPVTYVHAVGEGTPAILDHPFVQAIGFGLKDVWDQPALQAAGSGVWNGEAAARLRGVLASLPPGPAVIHVHQWTRAFSPAILPVCLNSGLPVAITLHDYFLACPNGVYYRFDKGEPCTLRPLSLACIAAPSDPRSYAHKAVRVLRTALTRRALRGRRFHAVHVSDRGRDTIAPFLPATVVHHRVDNPVAVARAEPAAIADDARIAFVGRLTREKGADLVAKAAQEAGLPALFIGEGPLAEEVRRIDPRAEVLGWRSPAEVATLLAGRVRAVVAPSRWHETGPLTAYEAAAAGVPAVVSVRAGAAEKVCHGETGYVVEPDVAALAEALRQLADIATARRLGRAAYDRYWAAPLTPERHAARLLEVYAAMLAPSPLPPQR
ncbi:MAG TPA: glycosyltransferase [Beijerinckiaceae bacterium]|jgi:glycosyltransferase involved in cell wall biosynthesis